MARAETKLIVAQVISRFVLKPLQDDAGERRNLEGAGADPEVRSRLLRALSRYQDYDAGTPAPGPSDLGPEERQRLKSLGYVN